MVLTCLTEFVRVLRSSSDLRCCGVTDNQLVVSETNGRCHGSVPVVLCNCGQSGGNASSSFSCIFHSKSTGRPLLVFWGYFREGENPWHGYLEGFVWKKPH